MKKLLILTDTTSKQINGVTRSIENLKKHLPENISMKIISTDNFFSVPFFGYKEIQLSLTFPWQIWKKIIDIKPDFIHIVTEGPIGLWAAMMLQKYKIPYTTSFHTKYPEYLNMRSKLIPKSYVHKYLHYVHNGAEKIFISHSGMIPYIERHKYGKYTIVSLGIDHSIFYPGEKKYFLTEKSPVLLYVGRLAIEKNIEDFLKISDKYQKIVVGDGPERKNFQKKYPNTKFLWIKKWEQLADIYRSADIFVFPSKTDTLGLVNLEAMACGKPVIAYNIENMQGIIKHKNNGILIDEGDLLENGIQEAMKISPENCTKTTKIYCWNNYVDTFLQNQATISKNLWHNLD